MSWHLFILLVTVKDGERAFLMRNGRFERVLEPGRHTQFDPRRELGVELYHVVRAEFPAERFAVLKAARPDLAAQLFEVVETKADEVAIVRLDGRPTHLMSPWQIRVFWKVATKVDVERIDVAGDPKVAPRHLAMVARERNALVAEHVVENHAGPRDTARHGPTLSYPKRRISPCAIDVCRPVSHNIAIVADDAVLLPRPLPREHVRWRHVTSPRSQSSN
jgi:hypothetical protein